MPARDPRIDAIIENAQPFARPILRHLRKLVHRACPGVSETLKWGMPSFEYKGSFFGMAAFKKHCAAWFRKRALIDDPKGYLSRNKNAGGDSMGNFGRITSLDALPPDTVIIGFLKQARRLNDDGARVVRSPSAKKPVRLPAPLKAALVRDKKARAAFDAFPPSHRREYADWVADAKTEATRDKRIQTTLSWLREGKSRNWKYTQKRKGNR